MKKTIQILTLSFCMMPIAIQAQIQITRTKIEQPEEVMIPPTDAEALKVCEAQIKVTQRLENKYVPTPGKASPLLRRFMDKKSQKKRIYAGPFPTNDITKGVKGIQGYYDAYFYDGHEKSKALTGGYGISIAKLHAFKEFHLDAEKNKYLKVLLYSVESTYDSVYVSIKNNKKLAYREWLIHYKYDPNSDTRYDVYKMYFLPTEDYQQQESAIQAKAEEEAKTYTMTNLAEVRYYIHYYRSLPYVEDAVKRSYLVYPVDNLPDLIERFGDLEVVEDIKNNYVLSRKDLAGLLVAYTKYPTAKLDKSLFDKKVLELINSLEEAEVTLKTIQNFSLKKELETKIYPNVVASKSIEALDKFITLFANGTKTTEAQAQKAKILQELEANKKRKEEETKKIEDERLDKLAKFGASGIFRESEWTSAPGTSIATGKSMNCMHIRFNDNKEGYIYQDVMSIFGAKLAGKSAPFLLIKGISPLGFMMNEKPICVEYATKEDAVKALHKTLGGEEAPMSGRVLNENEQNALKSGLIDYENMAVPAVKKAAEWSKSNYSEGATHYFTDGINGDLFRRENNGTYKHGVSYTGLDFVTFDSLDNALRALYLYKKYNYKSQKGKN